jgi:hypothetical protein
MSVLLYFRSELMATLTPLRTVRHNQRWEWNVEAVRAQSTAHVLLHVVRRANDRHKRSQSISFIT